MAALKFSLIAVILFERQINHEILRRIPSRIGNQGNFRIRMLVVVPHVTSDHFSCSRREISFARRRHQYLTVRGRGLQCCHRVRFAIPVKSAK